MSLIPGPADGFASS